METVANKNHANYWHSKKLANRVKFEESKCGTINAFSTVPKVDVVGNIYVFENCTVFNHPLQNHHNAEPPQRSVDDIKTFSEKSRKHLFNIFNCLEYSKYGLPCFISATWHYDAPDSRTMLKDDLEKFVKMLKRGLPEFHAIWKLEYQQRGTPHFHFILLPLNPSEKMYSPAHENFIKSKWLQLKKCKCSHCKNFSIKTVSCENYKMSISYISKEIAKVQDNYFDHDLGRIWGTSQNMRMNHKLNLPCPIELYHKILDRKLEENFKNENQKLYINGIRFLEQNSSVFISAEKIKDIISDIRMYSLPNQTQLKKYILKRSFT
jgi:hypothetical protein